MKRNFIWQRLAGLAADGLEDGVALRRCGGADGCAGAGGAGAADGDVLEEAMERRLVRLCARWLLAIVWALVIRGCGGWMLRTRS